MLQELKSPNSRFGKFDEKVEGTIRGGFAASTIFLTMYVGVAQLNR